jgi:hypothetical protein
VAVAEVEVPSVVNADVDVRVDDEVVEAEVEDADEDVEEDAVVKEADDVEVLTLRTVASSPKNKRSASIQLFSEASNMDRGSSALPPVKTTMPLASCAIA